MSPPPLVHVVMSVFAADPRFLDLQIASVLAQDHRNLRLLVTGDGAPVPVDPARYAGDARVAIVSEPRNAGVLGAFVRGVDRARTHWGELPDHYAFADQDDVWRPDKLSAQLVLMRSSGCILCHTDAEVTDADGAPLAPSMFPNGHSPTLDAFRRLMLYNDVTGMTALLDARFITAFLSPPPLQSIGKLRFFHDWWAALTYSWQGGIGFLPRSTVRYRQHGDNAAGVAFRGVDARPRGRAAGRPARERRGGDVSRYADRAVLAAHLLMLVERGILPRRPALERFLRARFMRADMGVGLVRDALAYARAGDRAARGASIDLAAAKLRHAVRGAPR